ncbi:hypothetical protein BDN72DRAFT_46420 [Pluteus cervinus]|uniref:Uncharacterized protein n=1 Tax=Pluteus cervinus TaxID=181527 RepID=A0ACD3BIF2_9AGAR|nr:hypothetical protein BDN72DRAFT_46420 [Pluteus cervinus]
MTSTPARAQQTATPKRPSKMASNQSLNHLLNFTLPPRQARPLTSLPRRSRKTGTHQGVWNKERFVNAQYRFVMNPTGDYTAHFADPDIFFQWHDILQVIIPRSSALASAAASGEMNNEDEGLMTCPICLSPPTAPRMTKCGHVFCFPCILHYLTTSENKWARCPICFDSVNERQLKSVKWYDGPHSEDSTQDGVSQQASSSLTNDGFESTPQTGSFFRMRLMQRPQITTLALPRSLTWPSELVPPHQAPWYFLPDVFSFAKFMLATPAYLVAELSKNLEDLDDERRILSGMKDDLGISFVDAADAKVRNQIAKAMALDTPILKEHIDKAHRDQHEIEGRRAHRVQRAPPEARPEAVPLEEIPEEFVALKPNGYSTPKIHSAPGTPKPATPNRNLPKQRRNLNPPPPSTSTYYYYQAASGLPIFLHPLDIKTLLSHFSSYSSFPDSIDVRVDAVSEGTVNDDLRKRCKYLAHLPEGADVVFVEADVENVVGAEGLKNFEGALKMRTSRRKEKERKDDRARARAEEREREKEKNGNMSWTTSANVRQPSSLTYHPEELVVDEVAEETTLEQPVQASAPVVVTGAWGSRSFASALHTAPTPSRSTPPTPRPTRQPQEDDWDLDLAWHELEQRSGGTGRKKRGNKLVVLGSGGGGRRR